MATLVGVTPDSIDTSHPPVILDFADVAYRPSPHYYLRPIARYYNQFIAGPTSFWGLDAWTFTTVESDLGMGAVSCKSTATFRSSFGTSFLLSHSQKAVRYLPGTSLVTFDTTGFVGSSTDSLGFHPGIPNLRVSFLPLIPTHQIDQVNAYVARGRYGYGVHAPFVPQFDYGFNGTDATLTAAIQYGRKVHGVSFIDGRETGAGDGAFYDDNDEGTPRAQVGVLRYCAVDGSAFRRIYEEEKHNTGFLQLQGADKARFYLDISYVPSPGGGGQIRNKSYPVSTKVLPAVQSNEPLTYTSYSEVGGHCAGNVYLPAVCKCTATFIEPTRLRVDASASFCPSAPILGFSLAGGQGIEGDLAGAQWRVAGIPLPAGLFSTGIPVEGVEVDGVRVTGPYIPSPVFDIIFTESDVARQGACGIRCVLDLPDYPVTTAAGVIANQYMSFASVLTITTVPGLARARALVRPSGELKSRAKSVLWQHRGMARFWAGEPATGNVLATDDEGTTYQLMANAWNGVSGAKPLDFCALPKGRAASIAKVGTNIQFRFSSDGVVWDAPVQVCPAGNGTWSIASHALAGHDTLTITDGASARFDSSDSGATWSAV